MVCKHYNKWRVSWHENKIRKRLTFDNEQEAIKFENEKRALNKLQRKQTKLINELTGLDIPLP